MRELVYQALVPLPGSATVGRSKD